MDFKYVEELVCNYVLHVAIIKLTIDCELDWIWIGFGSDFLKFKMIWIWIGFGLDFADFFELRNWNGFQNTRNDLDLSQIRQI
ncbi:hypothetical protein OUZ56_021774 [Daphnia magna]|uniref:Uncharacterized protein n=1 Tax=Daphnia magna TaxID=35525 RepID=A0ABR0AUI6_9CRUS|nr:hypothetical protein OUZ56_021774 [Daphnia magna]